MVRHALDVGADRLELQSVDLVPETAGALGLDRDDLDAIERTLEELRTWTLYCNAWIGPPPVRSDAPEMIREELREFGRFLRSPGPDGFVFLSGEYLDAHCCGDHISESEAMALKDGSALCGGQFPVLRCPAGQRSQRVIRADQRVDYVFPARMCTKCTMQDRCGGADSLRVHRVSVLNVDGYGSFLRRLRVAVLGLDAAEAGVIRDLPCLVGYSFSRIDYRGNVLACCKGSAAPLGSVAERSFASVWRSPRYQEFRENAATLPKTDPYFDDYQCLKACDNVGTNLQSRYALEP